jgi:hypothetical protein
MNVPSVNCTSLKSTCSPVAPLVITCSVENPAALAGVVLSAAVTVELLGRMLDTAQIRQSRLTVPVPRAENSIQYWVPVVNVNADVASVGYVPPRPVIRFTPECAGIWMKYPVRLAAVPEASRSQNSRLPFAPPVVWNVNFIFMAQLGPTAALCCIVDCVEPVPGFKRP